MSYDENFDEKGKYIYKGRRSLLDRFKFDTTDLIRAIENNDTDEVYRVLKAGIDPNKLDGMERLALPIAVDANNPTVIRLLLQAKADPNVSDKTGESALYKAVNWENAEIVKLLLDAGGKPTQSNAMGETAEALAKASGFASLQALADKAEAVANAKKAAREKEQEAAKIEAAAQAKVEAERANAEAKKRAAILTGRQVHRREETVEKLEKIVPKKEENKVKPDTNQEEEKIPAKAEEKPIQAPATPAIDLKEKYSIEADNYLGALLKAIQDKDSQAVHEFSKSIKDINEFEGESNPLALAISMNNDKLGAFLLKNGADPFVKIPNKDHALLNLAINNGMDELVETILSQNPEGIATLLNDANQKQSPLAAAVSNPKLFHLLLSKGADPAFGGDGMASPIEMAISNGPISILPTLAANQVDLNNPINGKTPLEWAIQHNKLAWVVGLIEEKANTDTLNEAGETPLMVAVRANIPEIVRVLIDEGADVTLSNLKGKTALDIAKELGGREEIVEMIGS